MLKPLAPPVAPRITLSFNPTTGTEDPELRVFKAIEYYYRISTTDLGTPFDSNSERFNHSCEVLTINASNPKTDQDNTYQFVWRDVGIQWRKYTNYEYWKLKTGESNLKISRRLREEELVTMFNECVQAIDRRFNLVTITQIEDTTHLPTVPELETLIRNLTLSKSPTNRKWDSPAYSTQVAVTA